MWWQKMENQTKQKIETIYAQFFEQIINKLVEYPSYLEAEISLISEPISEPFGKALSIGLEIKEKKAYQQVSGTFLERFVKDFLAVEKSLNGLSPCWDVRPNFKSKEKESVIYLFFYYAGGEI
jgi:hypothetical protein